jgi:hypothetical protein
VTSPEKAVAVGFDPKWIAGFFDGEGCVGVYFNNQCNGTKYYCLSVQITQSGSIGRVVMDQLKEQYGGSVYERKVGPGRKVNWKWSAVSNDAVAFLKDIVPYLFVKKEQAELAIQFQGISSKRIDSEEAINLAARIKQAKVDI